VVVHNEIMIRCPLGAMDGCQLAAMEIVSRCLF